MRTIRIILVVIGALTLGWGAYVMFDSVRVPRIPGVALWVGAAIVLHDAILAPIVFAIGILIRRAGHRLAGTVVAVLQGAIVVGSIMSLIVVLAIVAQNYAPANPTILPLNYGLNLAIFWVVLAAAASGLSIWFYARTKRANARPSSDQV